jgi:hypothetical protein
MVSTVPAANLRFDVSRTQNGSSGEHAAIDFLQQNNEHHIALDLLNPKDNHPNQFPQPARLDRHHLSTRRTCRDFHLATMSGYFSSTAFFFFAHTPALVAPGSAAPCSAAPAAGTLAVASGTFGPDSFGPLPSGPGFFGWLFLKFSNHSTNLPPKK